MASTLIELCNLLSTSVAAIDTRCKALSRTYPDLNDPDNVTEDESVVHDSQIVEATSIALAAASQLIAHMQLPARTIHETSLSFLVSAALGVVSASATAEIIREAGPKGCHIDDIAKKNGMDSMKIARVLRPLATQHIFREVSPDVFAHNRISIMLDTGKNSEAVLSAPEDKHQGAIGFAAIVELNTDETLKAGAYIQDVLLTHKQGTDELDTPLNRAFNTHIDLFSWLELPENQVRFRRFGMAMDASRRVSPPAAAQHRFKWSSLSENTLIVDVGGGVGSVSLQIAKSNPKLRFLIQDTAAVVEQGKEYWEKELSGAAASGRVSFQVHDFFSPQPVKDADVFVLSRICHDWSDSYVLKILKYLRDAAQRTTKLIIVERITPFVCGEDQSYGHIPGAVPSTLPPKPLLANMGRMGAYLADMQMMSLLSGMERTLPHYCRLLTEAGWEIEEVYRAGADSMNQIVAKPIVFSLPN
ncbi:O-methyltransferase [Mycena capillaripes]|nr:O-methyltransferase [Mycena capillaripes]